MFSIPRSRANHLRRRFSMAVCGLSVAAAVLGGPRAQAQDFAAPTPPPHVNPGTSPTASNAARLLTQATFGPTDALINQVQASGVQGFLDDQFSKKPSSYVAYLQRLNYPTDDPTQDHFSLPWWSFAVSAPDQLRQRVAFALSEIMVVSGEGPREYTYGLAGYMDVLSKDCFGTFRKLLQDVTLSPEMGHYLNVQGNVAAKPNSGEHPDENYAREVMQLFTIGLNQLNPDGTLQLDADGQTIPTYTQDTVTNFARVFTGWTYAPPDGQAPNWKAKANWLAPMVAVPGPYHDTGAKTLLNGKNIPAGGTAESDLNAALDNLANHPNVGPFISFRLIQRLVTSNPSKGYVYRVASVFNDNGAGVRGDLKAVVTAILTDYEARNSQWAAGPTYGKEREPVIRLAAVLRAFQSKAAAGSAATQAANIAPLVGTQQSLGQAPLEAPSVFNFFQPAYTVAGPIAGQGLVAPEFQITTESTAISSANLMHALIYGGLTYKGNGTTLDLSPLTKIAGSPDAVTAYLNRVLMAGGMSQQMQDVVTTAVATIKANNPDERARTALEIVATSPEFAVQK